MAKTDKLNGVKAGDMLAANMNDGRVALYKVTKITDKLAWAGKRRFRISDGLRLGSGPGDQGRIVRFATEQDRAKSKGGRAKETLHKYIDSLSSSEALSLLQEITAKH